MNFLLLTVLLAPLLLAWSQEIGNLEDRTKADVRIVSFIFLMGLKIFLCCPIKSHVLFTDCFYMFKPSMFIAV